MTSELEQKFYDTFGIKPEFGYWCKRFDETGIANCNGILDAKNKCAKCENGYIKCKYYPEITSEKLLELICILNETSCEALVAENTEDLKNEILETCIKVYNTPIITSDGDEYKDTAIYDKIQQLFKDEQ